MGDKNQGHTGLCSNIITERSAKFGGKIWISTTNGTCSYECIFCSCTFVSANSFEQHIPTAHSDQRQPILQPTSSPPPPASSTTQSSREQNVSEQNSNQSTGRKSNDFHGAHWHRRASIDMNRRRDSIDVNRRRDGIDTNRQRGKPNVPPRPDGQQNRRHVKTEIETFPCMRCESRFRSFESLRDHVRRRHSFRCTHCVQTENDVNTPKAFETEKGLWSHQRNHHSKQFPYKCDVCIRAFDSRHQRKGHMEAIHVRGNNVKCDFCDRILMSAFQKKNHIKRRHSNRRYYCHLCKYFHFMHRTNFFLLCSFRSNAHEFHYNSPIQAMTTEQPMRIF